MAIAFRTFAAEGIVALFDEPNDTGDVHDIDAPRNAPAKSPEDHLDKIYFHSSLDNLEVESDTTVAINHSSVAGASSGSVSGGGGTAGGASQSEADANLAFAKGKTTHNLVTHDLGYVPDVLVLVGDLALAPGMPVQVQSGGRMRFVTPYVTTTQVRIAEWSTVSASALSSVSLDYRVMIFRAPPAPSGDKVMQVDSDTGLVTMAQGRFDSSRRYLQVVSGGTPFGISYGKTIDLKNGAPRFVDPDGDIYDPVPDMKYRMRMSHFIGTYTGSYGASMAYDGSFSGSPSILVQAP